MIYELIATNCDGSETCLWSRDLTTEERNMLYSYLDHLGRELIDHKRIKLYLRSVKKHGKAWRAGESASDFIGS